MRGDAKPGDATSEGVHDQHHPMAAQKDGFNAEEIDTPDAVLRVSDERISEARRTKTPPDTDTTGLGAADGTSKPRGQRPADEFKI